MEVQLSLCPELCVNHIQLCLETLPENALMAALNSSIFLPAVVYVSQMDQIVQFKAWIKVSERVSPVVAMHQPTSGLSTSFVLLLLTVMVVTVIMSLTLHMSFGQAKKTPECHTASSARYLNDLSNLLLARPLSDLTSTLSYKYIYPHSTPSVIIDVPEVLAGRQAMKLGPQKLSQTNHRTFERVFSSITVSYAALIVGEKIGQGAFGEVYRGKMRCPGRESSKEIAIKTVRNISSRNEVESFFAESVIMKDLEHPNILSLTGVCFDTHDKVPLILLPFMTHGSLKDYLKRRRTHTSDVTTLPEGLVVASLVHMCIDIARGMEYLAGRRLVHRDLAARNCMVDKDLTVKVGDFGLARDVYTSLYYRAGKEARLPVRWMAPEALHDRISNEKTDVWSYGVTCWEVFSLGRTPYPGIPNHDITHHITGRRLERPSLCPPQLYSLVMISCWELKPEKRLTFKQLVGQLEEHWEEEHAYVVETTK